RSRSATRARAGRCSRCPGSGSSSSRSSSRSPSSADAHACTLRSSSAARSSSVSRSRSGRCGSGWREGCVARRRHGRRVRHPPDRRRSRLVAREAATDPRSGVDRERVPYRGRLLPGARRRGANLARPRTPAGTVGRSVQRDARLRVVTDRLRRRLRVRATSGRSTCVAHAPRPRPLAGRRRELGHHAPRPPRDDGHRRVLLGDRPRRAEACARRNRAGARASRRRRKPRGAHRRQQERRAGRERGVRPLPSGSAPRRRRLDHVSLPLVLWTAFVLAFATLSYAGRATEGKPKPDVLYQWSTLAAYAVQYLVIALIVWGIAGLGNRRELFALRRPTSWARAAKIGVGIWIGIGILAGVLGPVLHPGREQGLTPTHWEPRHAGAYIANGI